MTPPSQKRQRTGRMERSGDCVSLMSDSSGVIFAKRGVGYLCGDRQRQSSPTDCGLTRLP